MKLFVQSASGCSKGSEYGKNPDMTRDNTRVQGKPDRILDLPSQNRQLAVAE
jgi:hypothetical protein